MKGKKLFFVFAILLFVFTGTFFACNEDRYADLKISVNSVASTSSTKTIDYNSQGRYYTVEYGDSFTISASVTNSSSISNSLLFTSMNDTAIHKLRQEDTSTGSRATFTAAAVSPNYNDYFVIKVESVETGRNSVNIYIRVVLPVEDLVLNQHLGMTIGNNVDLNENTTYLPNNTNEKGADYILNYFADEDGNTYPLYRQNEIDYTYYFEDLDGNEIEAFELKSGILILSNDSLQGKVNVTAVSKMYDASLEDIDYAQASDDVKANIDANKRLASTVDVAVVKAIELEDISFIGGQVVFNDTSVANDKLDASLYLNSMATYTINGAEYYYNYEDITFSVFTKANVKINAVVGSMIIDGEEVESDNNVVSIPSYLGVSSIYDGQEVVGYRTNINIRANGGSGHAYIDFVVEYLDFDNVLKFKFSDLYGEYLSNLDSEDFERLNQSAKTNKLVFEATALPAEIALTQDDVKIVNDNVLKVYDLYSNNSYSNYGTKIGVSLTLSSGVISSKMKDENKIVRVYVTDTSNSGIDVRDYFVAYNEQFNIIGAGEWGSVNIDDTVNYYFDLDLSKNSSSCFYIKASTGLIPDINFSFRFENLLTSNITAFNGSNIEANSTGTTLKNLVKSLTVKAVKGINDILVVTKISTDEENVFYSIDSENVDESSLYNKLVLQLNTTTTPIETQGTIIAMATNLYVYDEVEVKVEDESLLKIFNLNFDAYKDNFVGSYNTSAQELRSIYSVVGIGAGSTRIIFEAPNGYKVYVDVEVVSEFENFSVDLVQGKGRDLITQNKINVYGESPYASLKFSSQIVNVVYKISNNAGIFNVKYTSSVDGIVEINALGELKTVNKGTTTITVEVFYYYFERVGNFNQWKIGSTSKSFVLDVFIAATSIRLDRAIVNAYDYNSLGYEYLDEATVSVRVVVAPTNANIATDSSCVTYSLINNQNNLIGSNGVYTAYLNKNQTKATVYIRVEVKEYGVVTTLNCIVNIYKAPQIEEISVSAFENGTPRNLRKSSNDENGHSVLYLSTENDKTITFNTSIIPSARAVYVDDLVIAMFDANQDTRVMTNVNNDKTFASFIYGNENKERIITEGQDSFSLNIGSVNSGYFYVIIFARDSMSSAISGKTFVKILVQVTDGTQEHPYEIETLSQLVAISTSPTKHYVMAANVSLASISSWSPIKNFTGSLNGYNVNIGDKGTFFSISGLKINQVESENVGLFATISNSDLNYGAVMNLKLKVSYINLSAYTVASSIGAETINIGALAGKNEGIIINCAVDIDVYKVSITNKNVNAGGLVGLNTADTTNLGGIVVNFGNILSLNGNENRDETIDFMLLKTEPGNVSELSEYLPEDEVSIISTNPVKANILISDVYTEIGTGYCVNVGGIAGSNENGKINGVYGSYSLKSELAGAGNVNYYTNYQSQGIDVTLSVNHGELSEIGKIKNPDSTVGGVVGFMFGGKIKNVSAEGYIGQFYFDSDSKLMIVGAKNNVGGIAGISTYYKTTSLGSLRTSNENPEIENVLAAVRLAADQNVGGIVGSANTTTISFARAEAYEYIDENYQTFIVGSTNIGGVAGQSISTSLEYVYSYSYISEFNRNYCVYGDIYSQTPEAVVGGVVGYEASSESIQAKISSAYSTFNMICTGSDSFVGGIIGGVKFENSGVVVKDAFYIGSIINLGTTNAFGVYMTDEPSSVSVDGYSYYYLLKYIDTSNVENGTNYDALLLVESFDAGIEAISDSTFDPTGYGKDASYNQVLTLEYLNYVGGTYTEETKSLKVPVYTIDSSYEGTLLRNFIRSIPNKITVVTKGQEVYLNTTDNKLELAFDTDGEKNYYFSGVDTNDEYYLIVNYSALNNEFSLNDLFTIIPIPEIYGSLNILVYSEILSNATTNVLLTATGELVLNSVGYYKFTFVVKENIAARASVSVYVVKNFDEILLSNTPTYRVSLFEYDNQDTMFDLRVNTPINVFGLFAEYVDTLSGVYYGTKIDDSLNTLYLSGIVNSDNYSLEYFLNYKGADNSVFIDVTEDQYKLENNSLTFYQTGSYRIRFAVVFNVNGTSYRITNGAWVFFVNVYSGATDIKFNHTDDIWLQGQEIYDSLQVILTSDKGEFEEIKLFVTNTETGYEFEYRYNEETFVFEDDYKENPFDISVSKASYQNDVYYYSLVISIKSDFRLLTSPIHYSLVAYDIDDLLVNRPAKINIVVTPQVVKGVSAVHYAYTQTVSRLENVANTEGDSVDENATYFYTFSNEPRNTVLAGNEGLFVIDIDPYYANIKSVAINSNVGADSGYALQFVQLVKISGSTDNSDYYIYAPMTRTTGDNGIYLNLYSYIPREVATLVYTDSDNSYINYATGETLSYMFGERLINSNDTSDVGRLYVKTVAPTNLKEEEQFVVTISVVYEAVNENGELQEYTYVYEHKLVVESMPGFSMRITHNGRERSVIAYTGTGTNNASTPDWLDVEPIVQEGYTYDSLTVRYQTTDNNGRVTLYENTEYVELVDDTRIYLGASSNVKPGDQIIVQAVVKVNYDGYTESQVYTKTINIVDVVIENLTIKSADNNGNLRLTVSTSKQLYAEIDGYGLASAISEAELAISRNCAEETNSAYYWQVKSTNAGEYYVNLESASLTGSLPFIISKLSITNEVSSVSLNQSYLGLEYYTGEFSTYRSTSKIVVLEGSTDAGIAEMRLDVAYVYDTEGKILFVPNTVESTFKKTTYFNVVVTEDSNEDNPKPIYDEDGLKEMAASNSGNYILMNDIEIDYHTALRANFASFDGNNKVITINSFNYSTNIASSNSNYSINIGLFDTVSSHTIIKNLIVAYPTRQSQDPMNLTNYSTINFGGICAINEGLITNCDVITVSNSRVSTTALYSDFGYTFDIKTNANIGTRQTIVNIGGFVGINSSSGIITNSRVGRDSVDILQVYDKEATVVYKTSYVKTAPMMLIRVNGRGDVGGFVATNRGTIATSYAKNLQLEIYSGVTSYTKTAGFAVTNSGYIYGSYSAGWEEESYPYDDDTAAVSGNRKLGGGLYSDSFVGGFIYLNSGYVEDCYSNINIGGSLAFVANTSYMRSLKNSGRNAWTSPGVGGFVFASTANGYITTSYSLSKISGDNLNTLGAFECPLASTSTFQREGTVENCYFMIERTESFSYEHEQAKMLADDPVIDLEGLESLGVNEFINKKTFNNFSFDNSITNFADYDGVSTGGVWAIYVMDGVHGYPELISANTVAISCRVINVTKTNNSDTNLYYYTYVDGYELGAVVNPYIVSNFEQYNNIFKDTIGQEVFNDNITTKFTGNIRLINNINFSHSEEVYSTSIEYTSLINQTSIFDGNYLTMYNVTLTDRSDGNSSFGLFKDIYYAAVKNLTLAVDLVSASNTTSVGALAGVIANSNISNVTLVAARDGTGTVVGNNYVGALAGIVTANTDEDLYSISDIKSNLSTVGGANTNTATVAAYTSSFIIWERIKPSSTTAGLSDVNNNLRLHRLPTAYYYSGGIAGILDLNQISEVEDDYDVVTVNAYNIHVGVFTSNSPLGDNIINYQHVVSVISDYAGGLFGLVGSQTYVERAEFIAVFENPNHFISGNQTAGGIAAVNFGKISQCYVAFDKSSMNTLNDNLIDYVDKDTGVNVHPNRTLFSRGTAKYIGGIVGINAGNSAYLGTGNIVDCYNRVDVKNTHAIGVGGIVGGTYIGQISNVYTTASLLGDLEKTSVTKMGAIIGKIFTNADEGYFIDNYNAGGEYNSVSLFNIVALNLWDSDDFDDLYAFVNLGGSIGALYGQYSNWDATMTADEEGIVSIVSDIYLQKYALQDYTDSYISQLDSQEDFNILQFESRYISLWGVQNADSQLGYDPYIFESIVASEVDDYLIYPNNYRALFSGTEFGVSTLRNTYFSISSWSRVTWNYDDENLLPILEYGYESSVLRIYTAYQFIAKLSEGSSAGKLYVIMNDIDFDGIDIVPIVTTFRGQLFGNAVTYTENGKNYVRNPILFNMSINATAEENDDRNTSIFAILQNSIGATFSNFDIVLKDYNVYFSDQMSSDTIVSVLLANATSTTINNVNIYTSLLDEINLETRNDYAISSSIAKTAYKITQGYYINDDKVITEYSKPYISLATLKSTDQSSAESRSFDKRYIFLQDESDENRFSISCYYDLSKKVDEDGRIVDKSDFDTSTDVNLRDVSDIRVVECSGVETNALTVGLIVGAGSLIYITNCSVDVDINVIGTTNPTNTQRIVYIGALTGYSIGEITYIVSGSKISYTCDYGFVDIDKDIDEMHIGGIVGKLQGVIRHAYAKGVSVYIGDEDRDVYAKTGASGFSIGGIAGTIDRYTTVNAAVVGGASDLNAYDEVIETYTAGKTIIGGIVGSNTYTISNITLKQTTSDKAILIHIDDENTSAFIGGLIALNKSTYISDSYGNISILVDLGQYSTLNIGGIIGRVETDCVITNSVYDAKEITIIKKNPRLGNMVIGGIIGNANVTGSSKVTLTNVFCSADISSSQEASMNVGGAIGNTSSLTVCNVVVLGNINLARGKGDGTTVYDAASSSEIATYYYNGSYYIGGLIGGGGLNTYMSDYGSRGTFVLGTIKDYALGQKTNVNIGPVIGKYNSFVTDSADYKTYFCEPISLVSDNGYNGYFKNVDQLDVLKNASDRDLTTVLTAFEQQFIYIYTDSVGNHFHISKLGENSDVDLQNLDYYSNFLANYFVEGSKIYPIKYTSSQSLQSNKYYVLVDDVTATIDVANYQRMYNAGYEVVSTTTGDKNWILNAQGFAFNGTGPAINTVTEGSAVVGLISYGTKTLGSTGAIARFNLGFIFSCASAGTINGSGTAGIVHTNYGVINSCFSIANIISGSCAGLVLNNGDQDHSNYISSIYSSYYNGIITPQGNNPNSVNISGIAGRSTYGVVSNCYTVGDIDLTMYQTLPSGVYPIANTRTATGITYNILNSYYDYLAYTGANEGVSLKVAKQSYIVNSIDSATTTVLSSNLVTPFGVYVWTGSLAGNTKEDMLYANYEDISSFMHGNWVNIGDNQIYIDLFKKSHVIVSGGDTEIAKIDTSWFNYGYMTNSFLNIIVDVMNVGGNNPNNIDTAIRFLELLYTGNGLKNIENESSASPTKTCGFVDGPYHIKHAGMLELLVKSNSSNHNYKYYIFDKDIDFVKYSGETYWSETWDASGISFTGSLDGNNKTVSNMYSTNGLLRAISDTDDGIDTIIKDLKFINCYSKTGIIVGYQNGGTLKNLQIGSDANYVYNGDYNSILPNGIEITNPKFIDEYANVRQIYLNILGNVYNIRVDNSLVINRDYPIFAGGLVGYMKSGTIDGSNSNIIISNLSVMADVREAGKTSYIGGIVGYMNGGTLGQDNYEWNVSGISVYSIYSSDNNKHSATAYAGGVVGAAVASDQNILISIKKVKNNAVTITSDYVAGGLVGLLHEENGCKATISNSSMSENGNSNAIYLRASYIDTDGNIAARIAITKDEQDDNTTTKKSKIKDIIVGGIVGKMSGGTLEDVRNSKSLNLTATVVNSITVGGICGVLAGGSLQSHEVENNSGEVAVSIVDAKSYSGCIIGEMDGGSVDGFESYGTAKAVSNLYGVAGGITGIMTKGDILNCLVGGNVEASNTAGGIAGEVYLTTDSLPEECNIKNSKLSTGTIQANESALPTNGGIVGFVYLGVFSRSDYERYLVLESCETRQSATVGVSTASQISGGIIGSIYGGSSSGSSVHVLNCTNRASVLGRDGTVESSEDYSYSGGIIGYGTSATVESCTNAGRITSTTFSGGIIGVMSNGVIKTSSNTSDISSSLVSGGIAAVMIGGNIEGSKIETSSGINIRGGTISGGLVGISYGGSIGSVLDAGTSTYPELINSSHVSAGQIAGGVIGYNYSKQVVRKATNNGNVTVSSSSISLDNVYILNLSYSDEEGLAFSAASRQQITVQDGQNANSAGGIVGYSGAELIIYGSVNNSSSTIIGNIFAGGIIGFASSRITITNVINRGNIYDAKTVGGIIASASATAQLVTNRTDFNDTTYSTVSYDTIINYGAVGRTTKVSLNAGGIAGVISSGAQIGSQDASGSIINNPLSSLAITGVRAGGIVGTVTSGGKIYQGINRGNVAGAVGSSWAGEDELSDVFLENTITNSAGGIVGFLNSGIIYDKVENKAGELRADTTGSNEYAYVGGVIGYMKLGETYATISSATFGTAAYLGGLIGYFGGGNAYGTVSTSSVASNRAVIATGGVIGYMKTGNINKKTDSKTGEVLYTVSANGVTVGNTNSTYSGGVVGYMEAGSIYHALGGNAISKNATETGAGGLVGYMKDGGISGGVGGTAAGYNAGGLVGYMEKGTISKSDKEDLKGGTVTSGVNCGGEVGYMENGNVKGGIGGAVTGYTTSNLEAAIGGLIGYCAGGRVSDGTGGKVSTSGAKHVGGLIGYMKQATLSGGTAQDLTVNMVTNLGGLVGYMEDGARVEKGSNGIHAGKTSTSGSTSVGGLVGYMAGGSVEYGDAGDVTVASGTNVGGLVGYMIGSADLRNATAGDLKVNTRATHIGGLVGYMEGGTVSGGTAGTATIAEGTNVGGLVGIMQSDSKVTGSCKAGSMTVTRANVLGGLVGLMEVGEIGGISNGTAGEISYTTVPTVGGLVGYMKLGSITGGEAGKIRTSSTATKYLGGIVGQMDNGNITGFPKGKAISAYAERLGGLIGYMKGGTVRGGTAFSEIESAMPNADDPASLKDSRTVDLSALIYGGLVGYMESGNVNGGTVNAWRVRIARGVVAGGLIGWFVGGELENGVCHRIDTDSKAPTYNEAVCFVGGLIGIMSGGTISGTPKCEGEVFGSRRAGGLVGQFIEGTINGGEIGLKAEDAARFPGSITVAGGSYIGGLCGGMGVDSALIMYFNGSYGGTGLNDYKDLIPEENSTNPIITRGSCKGNIAFYTNTLTNSGASVYLGGLVGFMVGGYLTSNALICDGNIWADASTHGYGSSGSAAHAGGLVGIMMSGSISGGKCTGNVEGGSFAGGVVGEISGSAESAPSITTSGAKIITGGNVGGIVGYSSNQSANIAVTLTSDSVELAGTNCVGAIIGRGGAHLGNCSVKEVKMTCSTQNIGGVIGMIENGSVVLEGSLTIQNLTGCKWALTNNNTGFIGSSENVTVRFGGGDLCSLTNENGGTLRGMSVSASGTIKQEYSYGVFAITNKNNGSILESINLVGITLESASIVGGFVATNAGLIDGCQNKANIKINSLQNYVGGIAGENTKDIIECINEAVIEATTAGGVVCIGGIAGRTTGTISGREGGTHQACFNSGRIVAGGSTTTGYGVNLFGSSYNSPNTKANNYYIGGIVGYAAGSSKTYGMSTGAISNYVSYVVTNPKQGNIIDYRGRVAGARDGSAITEAIDYGANKHIEFEMSGKPSDRYDTGSEEHGSGLWLRNISSSVSNSSWTKLDGGGSLSSALKMFASNVINGVNNNNSAYYDNKEITDEYSDEYYVEGYGTNSSGFTNAVLQEVMNDLGLSNNNGTAFNTQYYTYSFSRYRFSILYQETSSGSRVIEQSTLAIYLAKNTYEIIEDNRNGSADDLQDCGGAVPYSSDNIYMDNKAGVAAALCFTLYEQCGPCDGSTYIPIETLLSGGGLDITNPSVSGAYDYVDWAIAKANQEQNGGKEVHYSQSFRIAGRDNQGNLPPGTSSTYYMKSGDGFKNAEIANATGYECYDCSSFVGHAFVMTNSYKSSGYSGIHKWATVSTFVDNAKSWGFNLISYPANSMSASRLQKGDLYCPSGTQHITIYIGNNQIVHASGNGNDGSTCTRKGADQVNVSTFYTGTGTAYVLRPKWLSGTSGSSSGNSDNEVSGNTASMSLSNLTASVSSHNYNNEQNYVELTNKRLSNDNVNSETANIKTSENHVSYGYNLSLADKSVYCSNMHNDYEKDCRDCLAVSNLTEFDFANLELCVNIGAYGVEGVNFVQCYDSKIQLIKSTALRMRLIN